MIREHIEMDARHGSPYDRGSADSYYGRRRDPHYYPNGTGNEPRVNYKAMTPDEVVAYHAGYDDNEESGDKKSYI
jgi:hypothetical protein